MFFTCFLDYKKFSTQHNNYQRVFKSLAVFENVHLLKIIL